MGDKYNIHNTQAGAIGKNATAINTTFNSNELGELQTELLKLFDHLSKMPTDSKKEKDVQSIKEAVIAAQNHEPGKVRTILKGVGEWVLGAAREIGVHVVTDLISKG